MTTTIAARGVFAWSSSRLTFRQRAEQAFSARAIVLRDLLHRARMIRHVDRPRLTSRPPPLLLLLSLAGPALSLAGAPQPAGWGERVRWVREGWRWCARTPRATERRPSPRRDQAPVYFFAPGERGVRVGGPSAQEDQPPRRPPAREPPPQGCRTLARKDSPHRRCGCYHRRRTVRCAASITRLEQRHSSQCRSSDTPPSFECRDDALVLPRDDGRQIFVPSLRSCRAICAIPGSPRSHAEVYKHTERAGANDAKSNAPNYRRLLPPSQTFSGADSL